MSTNQNISELLQYFVDGTELNKEEMNTLLKYFLIERIDYKNHVGYILTIAGKTMLKQLSINNKGA